MIIVFISLHARCSCSTNQRPATAQTPPIARPQQVRDKAACSPRRPSGSELVAGPFHSTSEPRNRRRRTDGRGTWTHRAGISVDQAGNVLIEASLLCCSLLLLALPTVRRLRSARRTHIRFTRRRPHGTTARAPVSLWQPALYTGRANPCFIKGVASCRRSISWPCLRGI